MVSIMMIRAVYHDVYHGEYHGDMHLMCIMVNIMMICACSYFYCLDAAFHSMCNVKKPIGLESRLLYLLLPVMSECVYMLFTVIFRG